MLPAATIRVVLLCCALCMLASAADVIALKRFSIALNQPVAEDTAVEFYTTDDGGTSWQRVPDERVNRPPGGRPAFVFTAPGDGAYGFWTRVLPANGRSEPAPRPGDAPKIAFVVDTTPPVIETFSAALERRSDGQLVAMASWAISDPHLADAPVQLEVSPGPERPWTPLGEPQPASGRTRIPVERERLRLRLQATDQAGNRSVSPATIPVILGQAPEPVVAEPAATAVPLPSLDEVEALVDRQLATAAALVEEEPTPVPEDPTADDTPTPVRPAPQAVDPVSRLADDPPHRAFRWPTATGAEPPALLAAAEAIRARRGERILFGTDAQTVLAAARAAVAGGDLERAADLYQRLHDSSVAADALPEEIVLALLRQRPIRARSLADQAPPETRTTKLRLAAAYAWFAENSQRSRDLLAAIPADDDHHPEATVLKARCLLLGNADQQRTARALLRQVARHAGNIGDHAQGLLNSLGQ